MNWTIFQHQEQLENKRDQVGTSRAAEWFRVRLLELPTRKMEGVYKWNETEWQNNNNYPN
jgi:hypothetical protein